MSLFDEYEVTVSKGAWSGDEKRCKALGHRRYQCGACKLGYFNVKSSYDHDDECPECKLRVNVRRVDRGRGI